MLKALALGTSVVLIAILTTWVRTPAPFDRSERLGLPFYASEDEAKPFPKTLTPESFPTPYVSHAYRVAKEIPGVLAQQPCYCECRSYKHRGLLSCFTSNHAAG